MEHSCLCCLYCLNGNAIYEFHRPKTKAGRRNIPMAKEVLDILLKQKGRKVRIDCYTPNYIFLYFKGVVPTSFLNIWEK